MVYKKDSSRSLDEYDKEKSKDYEQHSANQHRQFRRISPSSFFNRTVHSTPVAECVLLVIDPNSAEFANDGIITSHDWRESGLVFADFSNGNKGQFSGGGGSAQSIIATPPQALVFLKTNAAKMLDLKAKLRSIREQLRRLLLIRQDNRWSDEFRLAADHEYRRLVGLQ